MSDRNGAFLAQVAAFLENDFTGEIVLHCNRGTVRKMDLKQQILPVEDSSNPGSALLPNSSGLTAVQG